MSKESDHSRLSQINLIRNLHTVSISWVFHGIASKVVVSCRECQVRKSKCMTDRWVTEFPARTRTSRSTRWMRVVHQPNSSQEWALRLRTILHSTIITRRCSWSRPPNSHITPTSRTGSSSIWSNDWLPPRATARVAVIWDLHRKPSVWTALIMRSSEGM